MGTQLQRGIVCLGLLLIAGSGLYAPWDHTWQAPGISQVVKPASRAWLFRPPTPDSKATEGSRRVNLLANSPPAADPWDTFTGTTGDEKEKRDLRQGVVLAWKRLAVEWLVIAAATGASLVLTSQRHGERESRPAT